MTAVERPPPQAEGRLRRLWDGPLGIFLRVLVSLLLAVLVVRLVGRPTQVTSGSMEPTLMTGDHVVVKRVGFDPQHLARGSVVAFGHGRTWQRPELPHTGGLADLVRDLGDLVGVGPSHRTYTVKRAIGVGGDVVSCCSPDGRLVVNGTPTNEPYRGRDFDFSPGRLDCSTIPASTRCWGPIHVPKGELLLVGDNRAGSADAVLACRGHPGVSTCARLVSADQAIGTVWFRLWPLS